MTEVTIKWGERTIFREINEKGWREQQEYRRRVWRNKLELELEKKSATPEDRP